MYGLPGFSSNSDISRNAHSALTVDVSVILQHSVKNQRCSEYNLGVFDVIPCWHPRVLQHAARVDADATVEYQPPMLRPRSQLPVMEATELEPGARRFDGCDGTIWKEDTGRSSIGPDESPGCMHVSTW